MTQEPDISRGLGVIDTNPAARRLYERLGFEAAKTEKVPFVRPIMGLGAPRRQW